METTVTTTQITDVRGKILKYLKIGKEPYTVIINIGEKTYNAVHALERAIQIPLTDNEVQADLMDMQQNDEYEAPKMWEERIKIEAKEQVEQEEKQAKKQKK